ncbi:MAG: sigma-70 family RNA polymerase sigma factor [Planctomycetes bacterium]|nr:sigma-70 family RNA polymerase sigma factor [Planctomycetota bacterium]
MPLLHTAVICDSRTPDPALVEACRNVQDERFESAFEELYRRYRDRVYSIAYRMTGTATDAMDVVQDAFRVLFLKISTFRFDSQFSTWLFRIVVNCSNDHRRRLKGRRNRGPVNLSSLAEEFDVCDQHDGPIESAETSEAGEHVHAALQKLSPKLRAILVLRYLEGLSYEQLAEALQVQPGTVKSRLARAHLALERVLEGHAGALGFGTPRKEKPTEPEPPSHHGHEEGVA